MCQNIYQLDHVNKPIVDEGTEVMGVTAAYPRDLTNAPKRASVLAQKAEATAWV
jgi:hypothetical protein